MKTEGIVNIIFLIVSFFMLYMVNQLPEPNATQELGPGFYPKLILYTIIFFNVLQLLLLFFSKSKASSDNSDFQLGRFIAMIAIMIFYVLSLYYIDYKIGTFLLIFSLMLLLGVKSYKLLFSVSAVSVGTIFLLFEILLNVHI
ncbi:tripartite tricarboxylate transporter TctB family protein [Mesobacillus jeotgali]|uniref:tripartite tricarboxylate transporter TctB family protein n=1 Tax=Mesobacillus jeotgali TaxID=129985 RepID=UPI000C863BD6|nr:tripartite tricarboxylate transporter TctB family protein [Mesobacillus jeotgali]